MPGPLGVALGALTVGGGGWRTVSAPTGLTQTLPFTVQQLGNTFRTWDPTTNAEFDVATLAPTGKAYYVSTTGTDSNDGLTPETPLRKILTAVGKSDVVEVRLVGGGAFGFTNGLATNFLISKDLSIIADQPTRIGQWAEGLSWTKQAAPNAHVYRASRTFVNKVADATQVDSNGDHTFLTTKASVEEVEAEAGSWYTDGTYVYVRTTDDRAPDANILCFFSSVDQVIWVNGVTIYLENLALEGGAISPLRTQPGSVTSESPLLAAKNCSFKYGGSNGLAAIGGACYLQDCVSACNGDDGLNYHKSSGGDLPTAVEIDCIGRHNGATGDIDNGSTMHDGGSILRLNCEYMRNVGPNVQDTGTSTKSWNLGCNAHDSSSAVNDHNWKVGGSSTAATMWLDTCLASGSAVDLYAELGATLYTRNTTGSTDGAGTIEAY